MQQAPLLQRNGAVFYANHRRSRRLTGALPGVPACLLFAKQASAALDDPMEEGTLLQRGIGAVQGQVQLPVQSAENHAVAAVVHEQGLCLGEAAINFPIIGYSGYTITSRFGIRTDGPFTSYEHHNGLDIACPRGTAIGAAEAGIVTFAGYNGSFGNVVFIEHGGGLTSVYAHCDSLLVTAGTKVAKDQVIARVGTTGKSSGYHLHFAVLKNGVYVDPEDYLYA